MNYDSPLEIRATLERLGLSPHKRWGQNFLVNPHARSRIVELLEAQPEDTVWEIGPGLGCLTVLLLPRVRCLVGFEVDWGLVRFLERELAPQGPLELVQGDVLKTWKRELDRRGGPQRLVGNLPYSSASALIADLAEAGLRPPRMVFTVQRELAQRMTAVPGEKAYSSFSVLVQVGYRVQSRMELNPGSFYPPPQVSSSVVVLSPQLAIRQPADRALFLRLVRALFVSRRKTLWNNLAAGGFAAGGRTELLRELLALEGIDPGLRSETLEPEQFVRLADRLAAPTGS
ncbi:MAG: ribosomal RNA small subunit methyltransferase A [Spirochaetales bacterium]|nr:ribosomal RNA small subunit methyltransferase A [Spirochaetales bacterium]